MMDLQPAFYRETDVLALVRCSRATLWRWRRAGNFPAPVELGPNTLAWRRKDVEAWIASRPVAPDTANARQRQRVGQAAAEASAEKKARDRQPEAAA